MQAIHLLSCSPLPPIWLRPDLVTRVGRGDECEIRIAASLASRQHAAFELRDDRVHVRDLGSSNGTAVNDTKVEEAWLEDGDIVNIGGWMFTYRRKDDGEFGGVEPNCRAEVKTQPMRGSNLLGAIAARQSGQAG